MPPTRFSSEEVVRRGEEIYARDLQARLEPDHRGEIVVIDIESGDFEVDADEVAALRRAMAKHPGAQRFIMRVGYDVTHHIGAQFSARRR